MSQKQTTGRVDKGLITQNNAELCDCKNVLNSIIEIVKFWVSIRGDNEIIIN